MKSVISIGNQDFGSIRDNKYFYVDKTDFIREWWENGDVVTLITRPRRFGKTLNMSMLEYFFSNQYAGCGRYFENLHIWTNEKYRELQGSYPVIFISFAAVKGKTYEDSRMGIIQILLDLYAKYDFLRTSSALNEKEKAYLDYIKEDVSDSVAGLALYRLALCLAKHYERKVLIFLDEYDTPLQEAYVNGYWNELTAFLRGLFNSAFKTNPYLERGILTGITRISKESIFSDLNNLEIVTTGSKKYETAFGFTEKEIEQILTEFDCKDKLEQVRYWYNGFHFGSHTDIYNPWSITKFLDTGKFENFWANTSSNSLIGKLIREGSSDIKIEMEDLLAGKTIASPIEEELVFDQLQESDSAVWSLLLASGYLKADHIPENGEELYLLSITNHEVRNMFRKMIRGWFQKSNVRYNDFIKALLVDDVDYMNEYMNQISVQTFSSFDTGKKVSEEAEPERFYHGFVLGLIVDLGGRYLITSNRESGLGRYDVMLEPTDKTEKAYIFEFKVRQASKEKSLEETVENALNQIKNKRYDQDLKARGIPEANIYHYGFAFEGKKVLIRKDA